MIRINLLPFRAARKRENVRQQISIFLLTITLVIAGMGYGYWQQGKEITRLKTQEKELRAELDRHKKAIQRVNELNNKIKVIQDKLQIIAELEKNKAGPVRMLEEISRAVVREQMWLDDLSENRGAISLKGTARDNNVVAAFMTNLERSEFIHSVELESTRMQEIQGLKLSQFSLTCRTTAHKEEKKQEPKKAKGRRR